MAYYNSNTIRSLCKDKTIGHFIMEKVIIPENYKLKMVATTET